MKTDSLFYRLFQTAPAILLQLVGRPAEDAANYTFRSVELKQTAFRIDGILVPTETSSELPTYFLEVQFQPDEDLYHRLFGEMFLYLKQHPETADWRAVAIFPRRGVEPKRQDFYREFLEGDRVFRIYLNELADTPTLPLDISKILSLYQVKISGYFPKLNLKLCNVNYLVRLASIILSGFAH